jgi:hypothetical protein
LKFLPSRAVRGPSYHARQGWFGRTVTVERKRVRLAYEPAGARIDRYGRTLAYLYLEPGSLFVNRELVAKGFEHTYTEHGENTVPMSTESAFFKLGHYPAADLYCIDTTALRT